MKLLRYGALGLVVLAILAVVAWTVANAVGTSRFNAALRALENDGFATSGATYVLQEVPVSDNAAPYLVAAFALAAAPPGDLEADYDAVLEKGAGALTAERRQTMRAWIEAHEEPLPLLERAKTRPRCRFDRPQPLGFDTPLPEITGALRLSKLLRVRGALLDGPGARQSVDAILAVADGLKDDPLLVSQLVRMTVLGHALDVAEEAVTAGTPEAELREWQTLVRRIGMPAGAIEPALRMELAAGADLLRGGSSEVWASLTGNATPGIRMLAAPVLKASGARYLEHMRRLVELSRKPYRVAHAEAKTLEDPDRGWISSLLLPSIGSTFRYALALDARAAVVRAGLEAEILRKSSGAYPASIEALDPATGAPLGYDPGAGRISSAAESSEPLEWRLRSR